MISLVVDELRHAGAEVELVALDAVGIAGSSRGARYLAPLRAWRLARHALERSPRDLVVCFGGEWGLFAWASSRVSRTWRLLQYSNGVESHAAAVLRVAWRQPGFPRPRWFQRGDLSAIHDLAFRHADHVAVVSEFDARYARESLSLPPDSVTVLSTPLPDFFLGLSPRAEPSPVIGYCGNWTAIKNVRLIAQDVQRFLRVFPGWRFEGVGPGTEQIEVAGAFGADVASRVRGLGRVPREKLPDWYRRCAVVLLPSAYDSFGLTAAEAMACGCAVIGSKTSGYASSLRHGEEVYLLQSTRSPELERALIALASDPGLLARIAGGGQRQAQALSRTVWRASFRQMLSRLQALESAPAGAS